MLVKTPVLLILLLSVFSCRGPETLTGKWETGKVDLSILGERTDALGTLDGPWKYTLKQFLSSEAFQSSDLPDTSAFFHGWGHFLPNGPNFGALSARVVITLPMEGQTWGLLLPDNYTAYSLYANGRLVSKIGNASLSPSQHRAVVRPETVMIQVPGRELELIVYNSNQEMYNGGFLGKILLGREETVMKESSRTLAVSLFTIGIVATVGILYIIIFLLNRKIRYNLYFGLLSLIVAFRMALMDQRILVFVTEMAFPLESDLEYGAVLAVVVVLGCLIQELFSKVAFRWAFWAMVAGHGFFLVALIILPVYEFARLFTYYAPLMIGSLFYYLITLFLALRSRLPGSGFFLFQLLCLGVSGILDYYSSLGGLDFGFHFAEVFLVAVIIQALWMAIRRSLLLDESKKMTAALQNLDIHRNQVMDSVARDLPGRIAAVSRSLRKINLTSPDFSLYQQKLLGSMMDSHDRLESLVDDLKSFLESKTDQGPKVLSSLDLGDIIREVSGNLPEKQLQLRLNNQVRQGFFIVRSDPSRLRVALKILFLHLLHLKPGNPVMVESGKLGEQQIWLSLTLMNHWWQKGQLADLFSPFAREPEGGRALQGSILDLPLAREYLIQAGGQLEAVNQGPGARFTLVLPSSDGPGEFLPAKNWVSTPEIPDVHGSAHLMILSGPKAEALDYLLPGEGQILAVDDEPINLRLLSHQLGQIGWSHLTADGGPSALEKVASSRVRLVLLDVMMPVMDGLSVLRELRKNQTREALPVVLVTAKGLPSDRLEGLNAGANAYVKKPFSLNQIRTLLTRLIRRLSWLESTAPGRISLAIDLVLIFPTGHPELVLPLTGMTRLKRPFLPGNWEIYHLRPGVMDPLNLVKILETQDVLRELKADGLVKCWGMGVAVSQSGSSPRSALDLAKAAWEAGGGLLADDGSTSSLPTLAGLLVSRSESLPQGFHWEDP